MVQSKNFPTVTYIFLISLYYFYLLLPRTKEGNSLKKTKNNNNIKVWMGKNWIPNNPCGKYQIFLVKNNHFKKEMQNITLENLNMYINNSSSNNNSLWYKTSNNNSKQSSILLNNPLLNNIKRDKFLILLPPIIKNS